jgi:hypothetical protein
MSTIQIGKPGRKGSRTLTVVNADPANPTVKAAGKIKPLSIVLGELGKGDARKVRRALHSAGFAKIAGTPRLAKAA